MSAKTASPIIKIEPQNLPSLNQLLYIRLNSAQNQAGVKSCAYKVFDALRQVVKSVNDPTDRQVCRKWVSYLCHWLVAWWCLASEGHIEAPLQEDTARPLFRRTQRVLPLGGWPSIRSIWCRRYWGFCLSSSCMDWADILHNIYIKRATIILHNCAKTSQQLTFLPCWWRLHIFHRLFWHKIILITCAAVTGSSRQDYNFHLLFSSRYLDTGWPDLPRHCSCRPMHVNDVHSSHSSEITLTTSSLL